MWPCTQFCTPKGLIKSDIWVRRFRPATAHLKNIGVRKWKWKKLFQPPPHISAMTKYFTLTQLFYFNHLENISTCIISTSKYFDLPSIICYDEIIFRISKFSLKRLLKRPNLFGHSRWIGLLTHSFDTFRVCWSLGMVWFKHNTFFVIW